MLFLLTSQVAPLYRLSLRRTGPQFALFNTGGSGGGHGGEAESAEEACGGGDEGTETHTQENTRSKETFSRNERSECSNLELLEYVEKKKGEEAANPSPFEEQQSTKSLSSSVSKTQKPWAKQGGSLSPTIHIEF